MNSPTFTSPAMTELGLILGTAAYMAPEQAKGKPVDKRADIWAFGCVLYEMLTARRLFNGESTLRTARCRDHVASRTIATLPANVPAGIRRLIQRCLEKDPRQRLRDIGEARIALTTPSAPTSPQSRGRRRRGWQQARGWPAGALLGAAIVWLLAGRTAALPAASSPDFSLRRLTELPGPEMQPDISPDGRQILFTSAAAGNRDVYLLRVGGARADQPDAKSTAADEQGAFSPDGERIAFRSERDGGGLFIMGATGESVRRLTTTATIPPGLLTASPSRTPPRESSTLMRATPGRQLWIVDVVSGKSRKVLEGDAVQPAWSPDGSRIAYWANTGGQRDIWTVDANGGTPVAVTQDAATDWSPEWSPDGAWLYFSSDRGGTMNLWRVAIDRRTGSPRGAPQAITSSLTGIGYARFAADQRRLAVMAYSRSYELSLAPFDPAERGKVGRDSRPCEARRSAGARHLPQATGSPAPAAAHRRISS